MIKTQTSPVKFTARISAELYFVSGSFVWEKDDWWAGEETHEDAGNWVERRRRMELIDDRCAVEDKMESNN